MDAITVLNTASEYNTIVMAMGKGPVFDMLTEFPAHTTVVSTVVYNCNSSWYS